MAPPRDATKTWLSWASRRARCRRTSSSQPATLNPNVIGRACWPCVRPACSVSRWRTASSAIAAAAASTRSIKKGVAPAQLQGRGGVEDVLGRRTPVDEARRRLAAQALELPQHGDERMLHVGYVRGQAVEVEQLGACLGLDGLGCLRRHQAELRLGPGQRHLDVEPGLQGRVVAPDRLCRLAEPVACEERVEHPDGH